MSLFSKISSVWGKSKYYESFIRRNYNWDISTGLFNVIHTIYIEKISILMRNANVIDSKHYFDVVIYGIGW